MRRAGGPVDATPVPPGTPGLIPEAFFKQGTAPGEPGAPPTMVIGGDVPTTGTATSPTGVEEGTGGLY